MDPVAPAHFTGAHRELRRIRELARGPFPVRACIVGTAGAGKTTLLRAAEELLGEEGAPTQTLNESVTIAEVPRGTTLVVDDLHEMKGARCQELAGRASDARAGLLVATRPGSMSPQAAAVCRSLESSAPAFVLDTVNPSDVAAFLDAADRPAAPRCVASLLANTGGFAWLVSHALTAHEHLACDDGGHAELQHSLVAQINHRLDLVAEPVLALVQCASMGVSYREGSAPGDIGSMDAMISEAFAEGLTLRNGRPPPIVRAAVLASISVPRLLALNAMTSEGMASLALQADPDSRQWLASTVGKSGGETLARCADAVLESDPERAHLLYQAASTSLGDDGLRSRQALAAWGAGDFGTAGRVIDELLADGSLTDDMRDLAACIWTSRGMMGTASDLYAAGCPSDDVVTTQALITHFGTGAIDRMPTRLSQRAGAATAQHGHDSTTMPSTMGVAMQRLAQGLLGSLEHTPLPSALDSLVQASELYAASGLRRPVPEPPAVIAAIVAVGTGQLATAEQVISSALPDGQTGARFGRRLLLWRSWLALQNGDSAQARQALERAESMSGAWTPRDEFLHHAVLLALARRSGDLATLESAWLKGREVTRRVEMDLYTLLPLSTMLDAASRLGDRDTLARHMEHGFEILRRHGDPPVWSTPLRWAAIQQGILLNAPKAIEPHARALVAMADSSQVARTMADAGRVWVTVLGGSVDVDATERAARGLRSVGLSWDGARLVSHAAGRTDERRDAARLLACARELNPQDIPNTASSPEPVQASGAADESAPTPETAGPNTRFSRRELDVVHLVLQGKTYAEIGQTIYVSPRTVEHHVARIRRRLGATSRSDLVAKLRIAIDEPRTRPPGQSGDKSTPVR